MSFDAIMAIIGQLTASTEAFAALGVRLQAEAEGIPIDVDVERRLTGSSVLWASIWPSLTLDS